MTRATFTFPQRRHSGWDGSAAVALQLTRSNLPFDLGCAHMLPDRGEAGRCQLWIGHQGEHAVMFLRAGVRLVRSWREGSPPQAHDTADCRCQPWVPGFPIPAWQEEIGSYLPSREVVAGTMRGTVADAMVHHPKVHPVTSTVAQLRLWFSDDHVHAALITVDDVLITVVDRDDVHPALSANTPAASLGTLANRVVRSDLSLAAATQQLTSTGRRRLAVIDERQRLLGLLCMKRSRNGLCSDQDVHSRQAETSRSATRWNRMAC